MLFLVEMFSWILPILAVLVLLIVIAAGYVKAPPDQAYIISGLKKEARILIGRAGIRVPFFERLDRLYLGQMTVDIKTEQSVPTNDFINVNVDAVAKVRISPTPEGIRLAAKNFLNKKPADITMDLQDSLQGNMREIIGTLSLKEINTDRDSFSDQVMSKASKDMDKLGIEILSCNIQNVTDENGLIKDLGADNTSKIKKDAAIAKAQADRDIAIAQAEADKASNDARVLAETEIAQKNNELAIRKAELQKDSDSKKAEADAAYEIQRQEQERTIQTATVNAQIAKAAREAELRKQEVLVQEQALQAEVNKKADADRYAVEQKAAADLAKRQREAEAKKYEMEKEAEALKAQAEKEAEAIKAKAEAARYASEQEAAGIKAKGEAEAAAIQAKLLADGYDYDGAINLLSSSTYASDESVTAAIDEYNATKETLVRADPRKVTHVFFHTLIMDTSKAFDGDSREKGYNQVMTTKDEFMKILQSMYERGFVLVRLHDVAYEVTAEDGSRHFQEGDIMLPEGKKPFVMSQDDVCYYEYMDGDGFASRMIIGEDGKPTNEMKMDDGSVSSYL